MFKEDIKKLKKLDPRAMSWIIDELIDEIVKRGTILEGLEK